MAPFYSPYSAPMSFGLPPLQGPSSFNMPNFGISPTYADTGMNFASNMPQATMNPGELRLAQLNQTMQPNTFLPALSMGIQGVNTLGNLFLGFQGLRQANQAAAWQRDFAERNYGNSVLAYNSAVDDKMRARYGTISDPNIQAQVDKKVKDRQIGGTGNG